MYNRSDYLIKDKPSLKLHVGVNFDPKIVHQKTRTEEINLGKYIINLRKYYQKTKKQTNIGKTSSKDTTKQSIVKSIIEDTVNDYRRKFNKKIPKKNSFITAASKNPTIEKIINNPVSMNSLVPKTDNNVDELTPEEYDNIYSYNDYRNRALSAVSEHKIFNVSSTRSTVRNALIQRGWVEKQAPYSHPALTNLSTRYLAANARPGNEFEKMFLSRIIGDVPINFVWGHAKGINILDSKYRTPYRSGIKRSKHTDFTNKEGLIACYDQIQWSPLDSTKDIQIPRSYRLVNSDECRDFLDNYRLTCCLNLLKFLTEHSYTEYSNTKGDTPPSIIEFGLKRVRNHIMLMQHIDLGNSIRGKNIEYEENLISDTEWEQFCYHSMQLIKGEEKMLVHRYTEIDRSIGKSKILLNNCIKYWPRLAAEGYNNLWILKPGFCCRGIGIVIKDRYENIIQFCEQNLTLRYVVQKYIEKPMLIYKTKFDIRQYILLTVANNRFSIWIYKNCYLRFSSQEYQLNELSKSIHVTNNCVQRHLKNGNRSDKLPPHNMWMLNEFKTYLRSNNRTTLWDNKIYPDMKNILTAIVVASLENTEFVPNTFALYGADFLLDHNYDVHLLEINASPDMAPTTCVTSVICQQVQEDLIKVVIDIPLNKKADTGDFELIYNVNCEQPPNEYIIGNVTGKSMHIVKKIDSVPNNSIVGPVRKKKIIKKISTQKSNLSTTNDKKNISEV